VTLTDGHLAAISRAVQAAGGDMSAVDLVEAWERLQADSSGRADRMRAEAARPRCCCVRGPAELWPDGRCSRCMGWPT
jgi:hypothetical protein